MHRKKKKRVCSAAYGNHVEGGKRKTILSSYYRTKKGLRKRRMGENGKEEAGKQRTKGGLHPAVVG